MYKVVLSDKSSAVCFCASELKHLWSFRDRQLPLIFGVWCFGVLVYLTEKSLVYLTEKSLVYLTEKMGQIRL